jgi:hypothetical protein
MGKFRRLGRGTPNCEQSEIFAGLGLQPLKQKWWPYADKIGDNHFNNVGTLKKHIQFREERGWVYEVTGVSSDPVVRLIDYQKPSKKSSTPKK